MLKFLYSLPGLLAEALPEILADAARMLPFLFVACLVVEYAEHRKGDKLAKLLSAQSRFGFLLGAGLGIVPQCGFSAMAADLYAGRVITLGTLLSVFIATSDEAFFVLLASPDGLGPLLGLLAVKLVLAAAAGFAVDFLFRRRLVRAGLVAEKEEIHCPCHEGEGERSVLLAAVRHTMEVLCYIVLFSALIHLAMALVGETALTAALSSARLLQPVVAAAIGLIPNCAASVLLAQLYLSGTITFASLAAGLSSAAGIGLVVLFRTGRSLRENLAITGLLFAISAAAGIALSFFF